MNQSSLFKGYCIDTNCIIEMWRRHYPWHVFPSLKNEIEGLVSEGRLITCHEVIAELERGDDDLHLWAKRIGLEAPVDADQLNIVKEILREHPSLVDLNKQTEQADPFLIALAESKGWTVVSSEILVPSNAKRTKIPNVCHSRNVPCIPLLKFIEEQGWSF